MAFRQLYLAIVNLFVNARVIGHLSDGHFFLMSLAFPMGWMLASALLIVFYRRSKLFKATEQPTAA